MSDDKTKTDKTEQPAADAPPVNDLDGLIEFTYDDHTYRVPADITTLDGDYADGILGLGGPSNHGLACKALLGEVQWEQFKARRPTVADYTGVILAFTAAMGLLNQGE